MQKGEIIRERKEAEYDIYGLDSEDIEADKIVKKLVGFGIFGSFRTWYILQHCNYSLFFIGIYYDYSI